MRSIFVSFRLQLDPQSYSLRICVTQFRGFKVYFPMDNFLTRTNVFDNIFRKKVKIAFVCKTFNQRRICMLFRKKITVHQIF